MKKYLIIIIQIIQSTLLCSYLSGEENYSFKQLSTFEGFPTSIQTIHAEAKGFVWIGSKYGLGRYNGYTLKTYTHNPQDKHSLPGNTIYQILEDSLQNIWVLTNQGTALYHRLTDSFETITIPGTQQSLKACAACCKGDNIIFISPQYIYQYNIKTRTFTQPVSIKNNSTFLFHEIWQWDAQTILCINRWHGAFFLDLSNGEFKPSPIKGEKDISLALIDSQDRVWTSAYNKGITCYNKKGEIIHSYSTLNSTLSHDVILCLSERNGEIWAGTDGGGINIINPQTHQIKTLSHTSGNKNSLPVNTIQCIHQQKGTSNCWAGSVKGGIINIRQSFIQHYTDVPLNTTDGLTEKAVLAFYQEPSSNDIWIGTDGGGINKFNPTTLKFQHYPSASNQREKIVSICGYNNPNELLVSIFSKGIFIFNKQTGELRTINKNIPEVSQLALYSRKSVSLYQDNTSSALIITSSIFRYDFNTRKILQITPPEMEMKAQTVSIGHDSLYTYLHDLKNIYAINQETNKISTIYTSKDEHKIVSVSKDLQGRFWIGNDQGLSCYNPKTKMATPIQTPWIKNISAIVCDNNNRVWIGTNEQLLTWIIDKNKLVFWDESDGVTPNEYLNKAVLTSSRGDIYMGGVNGMLRIIQEKYKSYIPKESHLTLTDIIYNNQSLLGSINKKTKEVLLNSKDKSVTIQVMAHEENIFRKKNFKWHINDKQEQTIETDNPEITLRTLAAGKYHIAVSCSTKDGKWSTPNPIITLVVPPAWYETWWFIMLSVLLVAAIIISIIINVLKRKEEKVNSAIKEHKQKVYEEKVRFLININHELRTPLTLIHTPLSHLIKQTQPENPIYPTLQNMLKQSLRMKDMLNLILNLRKMEMSAEQMHIEAYSLNEWIKEVGADFNYEEKEKQITITYELDSHIKLVEFDKEKHLIILTNLITNAFKHSPQGSYITLNTELLAGGNVVRISVSDQGCGLQEVDMPNLFTRFYQGKNEKEGSGIGLSYAKILVEQHHGKIGARNNPEGGACFYYELPIHQEGNKDTNRQPKDYLNYQILAENLQEENTYTPQENSIDTKIFSCLFVDDNEDIRNLAVGTLQEYFKNIYLAGNGKEALEIALTEIPDVIISDIMMPQMNGYELCKKVKENMNINHIQVILLTARVDEQSHLDGYRIGADAYLEKPFDTNMLLATIKNRLFLREITRKRYMLSPATPELQKPLQSADDTFLFRLNKLIIEHMADEQLSITFLCQEMGMSRASLYNKLKSLTNIGPNEYINKIRMENAMDMLRKTRLSMTEVAEKTGFSSSRYFSTAFKKFTGMTPSQYKESIDS